MHKKLDDTNGCQEWQKISATVAEYRLNLVRQILQRFHTDKISPTRGERPSKHPAPLRLTARHFPKLVPSTEKKKNAMRVWHVCSHTKGVKKRKESRYMCEQCDVGLCVAPCFGLFHTVLHF